MTGNQLKAARALAGLEQADVASSARVSINTVRNMEAAGKEMVRARLDTLTKVCTALEAAGVEFIPEKGAGVGVRLRK
ncbi:MULTISPECIES: helix-turn-helix domain-containing protein [unclassified Haematobacter]|uniref:helix-turn-helix domain-containing protein n=1 Tax=unclassified Haematobacter TaxID=2640585 RepID=UPI0025C5808F|nr:MULTISPECIES: helix-turn-helix transcriptional regulator [unclassified Haematobacter]